MGWLITGAVLIFLLLLPLGIRAQYDTNGAAVWITVGVFQYRLHPKASPKKREKKSPQTAGGDFEKKKTEKKGGSYKDFLPIVQDFLDMLLYVGRKLRVKCLEMKLIMAGGDPCSLAVNYGRAWAALGNLMPQLDRVLIIKKRALEVECDFTADETLIYARMDITITLGRLLWAVLLYGGRILKKYLKIMNQRKGGAKI